MTFWRHGGSTFWFWDTGTPMFLFLLIFPSKTTDLMPKWPTFLWHPWSFPPRHSQHPVLGENSMTYCFQIRAPRIAHVLQEDSLLVESMIADPRHHMPSAQNFLKKFTFLHFGMFSKVPEWIQFPNFRSYNKKFGPGLYTIGTFCKANPVLFWVFSCVI